MVLEARYKAEKVWYPVVWEKEKTSEDVIDYDIREEQTKDISAIINANNQTTTGMANVIPWVNAPKLLEATSIISIKRAWYFKATFTWWRPEVHEPWWQETISDYVISDEVWSTHFTLSWNNKSRIVFPADWTYQLDIIYPKHWSSHYRVTRIYNNSSADRIVRHVWTTWSTSDVESETIIWDFKKWDKMYAICEYWYVGSWTWGNRSPTLTITASRLW